MDDLRIGTDAFGLDQPLVHCCGDIACGGIDGASKLVAVEAASLGGAVGAFSRCARRVG
ncbi:hypothetical protein ABZ920_01560 [Streptomyces sp. NPDC046831]|uniref:hypothetical protein n=1 Tax=Streptomyces sp. NPDC046831 TaxID=3154805 RepID=UPI0033D650CC